MALRRPEHPERVAIVAVILVIVANLAYFGTRNEVRGTPAPERPSAVLQLSPQEGEDILPQASIVVDLRPENTAQLSIDGKLVPQDQVTVGTPNVFELSFQPKATHDIHQFSPGSHYATIEYWPRSKTYEQAKAARLLSSYTWKFKVG